MSFGFLLGTHTTNMNDLYIVTMLIAISYGIIWTVVPILVGEYFGLISFAKNWYVCIDIGVGCRPFQLLVEPCFHMCLLVYMKLKAKHNVKEFFVFVNRFIFVLYFA